MEDFLSIKAIKEISTEKIESFDYISSVFQGGYRRAGRDFFLYNLYPCPQKDWVKLLIFYSHGYRNSVEMKWPWRAEADI